MPVDYEIIGFLLDPIEQSKSVRVLRIAWNGQEMLGIYQSTTVVEVRNDGYVTRNSVYCVEVVMPPNP